MSNLSVTFQQNRENIILKVAKTCMHVPIVQNTLSRTTIFICIVFYIYENKTHCYRLKMKCTLYKIKKSILFNSGENIFLWFFLLWIHKRWLIKLIETHYDCRKTYIGININIGKAPISYVSFSNLKITIISCLRKKKTINMN